ncbi:MAG: hypothetical protein ACMG6S_06300 [Byssovorax sp.]
MRTEFKALFTGVVALSWAVLLAGCPGKLREPERFTDGGTDGGGCPDVVKDIFQAKCAGSSCHGGTTPVQDLDLVSADVASRVVGKAAIGCKGTLADPEKPEDSILYIKVAGATCGGRMPPSGDLSDTEIACVKDWIAEQTAVGTSSTASGTGGAGGAGGAGGGTSTSTGN